LPKVHLHRGILPGMQILLLFAVAAKALRRNLMRSILTTLV
jgi:hypothetical protein